MTEGEVNKQLWDEALTRLLNLSTNTVKQNLELEARVLELEVELSVWKQAHSVALDASERETKAHNVQVATLNKQLSAMEPARDPLIYCVIDGDANIFSPALLVRGQSGGRQASQALTKGIAEYLSKHDVQISGRLSFWVTVYFNRTTLLNALHQHNICTQEQFDDFLSGFSQASPRFLMIDVGGGKDMIHSKIKEYLQTHVRFSQTLRVFFAGPRDAGYMSALSALEKESLLGKIVKLEGYATSPFVNNHPLLPTLMVDGLFMAERLAPSKQLSPLVAPPHTSPINGGLATPQSPARGVGRLIDSSLPLHKQAPPPCNEHYLMACSKGSSCRYSHDYLLSPDQLMALAENAKKAPCNWLKNGLQCPYGDKCCWGHFCPNGIKCFHLSKGKCWFKGEGMHPINVPLTSEESLVNRGSPVSV
jgi:hypothetical protein